MGKTSHSITLLSSLKCQALMQVNNDLCYKWPASACSSILYDLRATLPLVEEDDNITSQSPYLILPILKQEAELVNLWKDYVGEV